MFNKKILRKQRLYNGYEMNYFIFYTAVYGLSWLIVYSQILEKPRDLLTSYTFFKQLTSCIVCTSFWISTFLTLFYCYFEILKIHPFPYLLLPYSAVAVTWIIANLIGEFDD